DRHVMGWRLFRVVVVGAHPEGAARNPDHVLVRGRAGLEDVRRALGNVVHGGSAPAEPRAWMMMDDGGDIAGSGPRPWRADDASERGCQWLPKPASIFSMAWSMVKLAARWRGGNSWNVARNGPTMAWAAMIMYPLSKNQS